jgi:hypothetical protein
MQNTQPQILTHKLLISNAIDNRAVVGIYDGEQHAMKMKAHWEACFTDSTFEIVENK